MQSDPKIETSQSDALHNLLDQAPATMFSVDRGFCYTAFNRKHARGMKNLYDVDIHSGDNLLECITLPIDRETARHNLERSLAGEEFVMVASFGSEERNKINMLLMYTPIRASGGDIVGVSVYSEDVTDLRKAEDKLLDYQNHLEGLVRERSGQLEASEALYRSLFENMNSLVLILDPGSGAILDANPAACAFYNTTHSHLTGLTVADLAEVPQEQILTNLQKSAAGEKHHFSARHHLANGQIREMEIYGGPLDFKGKRALLGILHDVTDRKLAERARQESEAKFKTLFHTLPLPSAIYRLVTSPTGEILDWIIEDVNDFGAAVYGAAPQDVVGRRMSEFIEARILAPYLAICQEIRANGSFRMFESFYEPTQRHYLTTAFMLSADLYAIINLDITEQKQAEERLRESEERYRLLFEGCLDGLVIFEPDGSVQAANRAAEGMFGWTSAELKHLHRSQLFNQDDPLLPLARDEHHRQGRYLGELTLIRKDGSKFPAQVSSSMFTNWRGTKSIGVFIYDLSTRRQLEKTLTESEERFNLLFMNSLQAILIANPLNGAIYAANPAARQMFGCTEAELCALGRSGIVDMSDPVVETATADLRADGKFFGDLTLISKDGTKFPAQVSTIFYEDRFGNTRSCVLLQDNSGRKLAETALRTAKPGRFDR